MEPIRFASIIVTYRCNAKCHMCNTWQYPTSPQEEITPALLEKLPHIASINVTGGEPFLRQDLDEILTVLERKAKRIVISTNGFWTDRILDVARRHPRVGVRVSLEGLPKANDELRGIPNGFDRAIRTITGLSQLGLRDIGFGITLSDRNTKDLMELYSLAKMMNVEFATAAVHNSFYFHKMDNHFNNPQAATEQLDLLIEQLLASRRIKDWFRAYFNHGLKNYIEGKPRLLPCRMGHNAFFLDPMGRVLPCNVVDRSMGNLHQSTFEEIWTSAKAQEIRKEVCNCGHNCWMMGSVSEAMKTNLRVPMKWVLGRKLRGRRSCACSTGSPTAC